MGGCHFFKKEKTPPFPGGAQILQKMAVSTSWIFWLTGKRRADVGRRRADVGQTSGTSGELKVVETGKNHLQWNRGGKIEKKEPELKIAKLRKKLAPNAKHQEPPLLKENH